VASLTGDDHEGEIALRVGISLVGRLSEPPRCLAIVLIHALALANYDAEAALCTIML